MAVYTDANTDIASMSDDDLMAEWTLLGTQVEAARTRLREFSRVHQERSRKEDLRRLANLSDEDMVLLQQVRAEGVESAEAVGVPQPAASATDSGFSGEQVSP